MLLRQRHTLCPTPEQHGHETKMATTDMQDTRNSASAQQGANGHDQRAMREPTFISDIKAIRDRARKQIEDGAVTPSYGADRDKVVELLNSALATETVCVLRYRRHYFM